jgi:phenylalanyl-tRNA synthetase beta chain
VGKEVTAVQVEAQIRLAAGHLLQDIELFDLYEGKQIGAGKRSLAYHLTFQSPGKTLTDKEVKKLRQRIIQQLERNLGAHLRQ